MTNSAKQKVAYASAVMILPLWHLTGTEFFVDMVCSMLVPVGACWLIFILCESSGEW